MEIEIRVLDEDGEVIIKRTALTFESAEEALGKLERYCKKEGLIR